MESFLDSIPGWVKYLFGVLSTAAVVVWKGGYTGGQAIRDYEVVKQDVHDIKRIIFRDGGGLNLMTETRHAEVCVKNFEFWAKDFEHLREKFGSLEEKVEDMTDKMDKIVSTGQGFENHAEELVGAMKALLKELRTTK